MDYFGRVRSIMLSPCRHIEYISFHVRDYQSVVDLWLMFKKGQHKLSDSPSIKSLFEFHQEHDHHVLLYSSKLLDEVLLMGKVKGKYVNIRAPQLVDLGNLSFVAVYA